MSNRQKDRRFVRFIGPADRLHGEHRGRPVEIVQTGAPSWLVRFPDGAVGRVHEDHLTDAIFQLTGV